MTTTAEALAKLDPKNDNHWTEEGLPRIETMRMMAGNPALTREDIVAVDPMFNRSLLITPPVPAAVPAVPPAVVPDPVLVQATESTAPSKQEVPAVSLEDQLATATAFCDELQKQKNMIDLAYADAQAKRDAINTAIDRLAPPVHKQVVAAIQEYQAAANREREVRGQKWQELKDAGIKLKDILPQRAAIDEARRKRR